MHPQRPTPATRVETELDALLAHIDVIALACAREKVGRQAAPDIAHDVVLECLIKIRDGIWDVAPDDLVRCVRRMVQSKAVDQLRQRQRRDGRELEHAKQVEAVMRAWMSPDQSTEERELEDVEERASPITGGRPGRYLMARDRGESTR
jgi:DNA-directed RNA polymerase specialized sigma24 family protein